MTTKLFMIRRISDGFFYNGKDHFFSSNLSAGTYALTEREIQNQIKVFCLSDCEIYKTNEQEFTEALAGLTTKAIIQLESVRKVLEDIKYSLPTISQINKNTGKHITNTIQALKCINPMFNEFLKVKEDDSFDVLGVWEQFVFDVSKVELYQCESISYIIQAFNKNPKAINGICDKILNKK